GIGRSRQCEYLMLLRSQATNQRPADRTGRPGDQDSHRPFSITAERSSAWPSVSFTDEGAASLLLVVLMRCAPWRSSKALPAVSMVRVPTARIGLRAATIPDLTAATRSHCRRDGTAILIAGDWVVHAEARGAPTREHRPSTTARPRAP